MKQNTIPVSGPLTVIVDNLSGDLQVAGWDRSDVSVKTDGDDVTLRVEGDRVYAGAPGDLILYLPHHADLQIGNISGDADIRAVSGSTRMDNVGGDLQMRTIGPTFLQNVSGDLNVRGCSGDFVAGNIGSDASLRDVQGKLKISTVGSDLYLRNSSADVDVQTGADAVLYLQPAQNAVVNLRAGGDILLRLPVNVDAELMLQGGSTESIRVDFAGVGPGEIGPTRRVMLGSGAAKINLLAGADVIVTSRADEGQPAPDFGSGGADGAFPFSGNFPGNFSGGGFQGNFPPADLHERINQRVQEATQHLQQHQERIEQRVEAAVRRAEEKMRAAERRSNFAGVAVGRGAVGRPPSSVVPVVNEPVSDSERLVVLQMLQDKKISLDEAEKLLAALEGK